MTFESWAGPSRPRLSTRSLGKSQQGQARRCCLLSTLRSLPGASPETCVTHSLSAACPPGPPSGPSASHCPSHLDDSQSRTPPSQLLLLCSRHLLHLGGSPSLFLLCVHPQALRGLSRCLEPRGCLLSDHWASTLPTVYSPHHSLGSTPCGAQGQAPGYGGE